MGSFSPLIALTVAMIGLGGILNLVGLATNYWAKYTYSLGNSSVEYDQNFGLWKTCFRGDCHEFMASRFESDLEICRAMTIVSLACAFGAGCGFIMAFALKLSGKDVHNLIRLPSIAGAFVAAVFLLTGVIYFSANVYSGYEDDLEKLAQKHDLNYAYSFALCIVGALLMIVSGVLGFVGTRK